MLLMNIINYNSVYFMLCLFMNKIIGCIKILKKIINVKLKKLKLPSTSSYTNTYNNTTKNSIQLWCVIQHTSVF